METIKCIPLDRSDILRQLSILTDPRYVGTFFGKKHREVQDVFPVINYVDVDIADVVSENDIEIDLGKDEIDNDDVVQISYDSNTSKRKKLIFINLRKTKMFYTNIVKLKHSFNIADYTVVVFYHHHAPNGNSIDMVPVRNLFKFVSAECNKWIRNAYVEVSDEKCPKCGGKFFEVRREACDICEYDHKDNTFVPVLSLTENGHAKFRVICKECRAEFKWLEDDDPNGKNGLYLMVKHGDSLTLANDVDEESESE